MNSLIVLYRRISINFRHHGVIEFNCRILVSTSHKRWLWHQIDVAEVTWGSVMTWPGSGKSGYLRVGAVWNLFEGRGPDAMVLRVNLSTTSKFTMLHVGTWSWSNLISSLHHLEPIMRLSPSSRLRVAKFRVLIIISESISRKLVSI